MPYVPTEWSNSVYDAQGEMLQKGTPLLATNMNKIEQGIVGNETALAALILTKGASHGIAFLDENGIIANTQIPDYLKNIDTHSHTNLTALDKIRYSGAKAVVDLVLLEELETHTHVASVITTNADNMFVSQVEKNSWNSISKIVKDVSILVENWVDDISISGYWKYDISNVNITADSVVDVNIHLAYLTKAEKLKSSNISNTGKVTIYASAKPTDAITCDIKIVKAVV